MKRPAFAKNVAESSKRVRVECDDGFYDSDEDLRLGEFIKASSGEDFYDRDEDRRLSAFIKASSGADFYDSDEDRRLGEFAAGPSCLSQTASGSIVRPADIEEHRGADDDFVALYDGWEEDAEDILIIPDAGDDAPFALQHGGFHGFDETDEENEEDDEPGEEDGEIPSGFEEYYEFVQTRRTNLERIDDVTALVEDIVQHLIDKATHSAKIARSIEKYDQSSNTTAFYGKRVRFYITVINEPRGAGGPKGAVITKHLNTNMDNIVKIPLHGRDCLAGAVAASLHYYTHQEVRAKPDKKCRNQWRAVERFVASPGFLGAVERVKHSANLPDLPAYGVVHARAIQDRLQMVNPDNFQIVIFAEKRGTTPIWKGHVVNPEHHLYIYLHNKHYDVMMSPERFFGLKNYCVSCKVKFCNVDEHSRLCAIRCPDCLCMGHGYPCRRDTKYDDPKYDGYEYDENGDKIERGPFPCHISLVSKSTRLYELLYDVSKEVQTVQPLGNGILRVGWRYKDRMDPQDENSNVVIAMFTTAYGRAELFKHMWSADERGGGPPGSRALYTDTDSVVTVRRKGTEPLKSGEFLGEMKDEHPKEEILEFVCGEITTTQKIRGITLDSTNGAAHSYDVMRDMVLRQREGPEIALKYERIHRDVAFHVSTVDLDKVYRPIFRKGWIDACLSIFPYGYIRAKAAVSSIVNTLPNRNL